MLKFSRGRMANPVSSVLAAFGLLLGLSLQPTVSLEGSGEAGPPTMPEDSFLSPDHPGDGPIYAGLESDPDGACQGLYRISDLDLCTHGFDPAPPDLNAQRVGPIDFSSLPRATQVQCDGDGVSGNRVQVIYAHPPGTDRYAEYLTSFQGWMADMDIIFTASAGETGGARHVRFVHDTTCNPVVLNVEVSQAAMDVPWDMWSELSARGYNRSDRKYLVFAETNAYSLGIANVYPDSSLSPSNAHNSGPMYTSTPVNLWGGSNPAHELMHTLGAVQSDAPHGTVNKHCWDEHDRMCYKDDPSTPDMQYLCPDPAHEQRFDCGHDDYFHTNPPAGSYLATHWNAANNAFLIGAESIPLPTKTWTGASSSSWSDWNNWSPNGSPGSEEHCAIPAGAPRYPVIGFWETGECHETLTVDAGAQVTTGPVGGLEAKTAVINGTVEVLNGSYFDVDTDVTIGPDGLLLLQDGDIGMFFIEGGTLTVEGTVPVTGTFPIYGSNPPAMAADLRINQGGVVEITEGGLLTVDGTVTNNGTLKQTQTVTQGGTTAFLNISTDRYFGVEVTLGGGGDMGPTSVTIERGQSCSSAVTTLGLTVDRCYHITPTTPQTATVRFYYRSAEMMGQVAPDAYHFNGATWDALASTRGGSGEAMYVQAAGVDNYSPFVLKDPAIPTYYLHIPLVLRSYP